MGASTYTTRSGQTASATPKQAEAHGSIYELHFLQQPKGGSFDVLVDGELRFLGRPGAVDQHRAVEIKETVT